MRFTFQDYNNMSKFLNRILGMPVDLQNRLFKYFTDTLTAVMEQGQFYINYIYFENEWMVRLILNERMND